MQKQLEVTPGKLEKIGFAYKVYPADDLGQAKRFYEIRCLNGCFYYDTGDIKYRWYHRIKVGSEYVSTHLDIQHGPQLFTVLRAFRVDYNFYNI